MNQISITGNLAREPELSKTPNGVSVCRGTVAVDRAFKKNGERATDYFDFSAFDRKADYIAQYAHKGDRLEITGRMESHKVEADGKAITYWGIVVENVDVRNKPQTDRGSPWQAEPAKPIFEPDGPEDEDLPF